VFESKNEELSSAKVDLNTVEEVQSAKSKTKIEIQDAKAESARLSDSLKADVTAPKMEDDAQADQPDSPAQSQVSAVEELNNKRASIASKTSQQSAKEEIE